MDGLTVGFWCPENMNVVAKEVLRPFARELELGMQRFDFLIRKLGRVGDGVASVQFFLKPEFKRIPA